MLALFDGVRLTPAQRRIAQCLLERGPRAAYLSSGELADLARVSQPSVTRFATALGYDGYPALRRALRNLEPAEDRPAGETEVQHALRAEHDALARLADRLADGRAQRAPGARARKQAADVTLTAPVGSRLVFDLHTGPMALAMVLLQAMCDAAPAQAAARLEEFEVSAARRGVFVA